MPVTASKGPRGGNTPLSDTLRSEAAEYLRNEIRKFAATPEPLSTKNFSSASPSSPQRAQTSMDAPIAVSASPKLPQVLGNGRGKPPIPSINVRGLANGRDRVATQTTGDNDKSKINSPTKRTALLILQNTKTIGKPASNTHSTPSPQAEVTTPATTTDTAGPRPKNKVIIHMRKRRTAPRAKSTSAFTDDANRSRGLAEYLHDEEYDGNIESEEIAEVQTENRNNRVSPPTKGIKTSTSLPMLAPLSPLKLKQSEKDGVVAKSPQSTVSPMSLTSPSLRLPHLFPESAAAVADLNDTQAIFDKMKEVGKRSNDRMREAYQKAYFPQEDVRSNGSGGDTDYSKRDRTGGMGSGHFNRNAQEEAFAVWQKECKEKIVEGRDAPIFRNAKAFKMGPKSQIAQKVFELRADPSKWYTFSDEVSQQKKERIKDSLAAGSFIQVNKEKIESFSPARRLPMLQSQAEARETRMVAASDKRHELQEEKLLSIEEKAQQRLDRIKKRLTLWMTLSVLGRCGTKLNEALERSRSERHLLAQKHAVCVFEGLWRRRKIQMSPARAYVVRARFLRRCLTKFRAKIMQNRYADRCLNLLRNITFSTRILVAFSHFHGRVVKAQRLWRGRAAMKILQDELRRMQWTDTAQRRAADIVMHISKMRAERGLRPDDLSHSKSMLTSAVHSPTSQGLQATRTLTTLGAVMLPPTPHLAKSGGSSVAERALQTPKDHHEDLLMAAEQELEDLRSLSDETRDAYLSQYLINQRKQFRAEYRKRDDYIAVMHRPDINPKELVQMRQKIPPKPRWRMILTDEVVVTLIRRATKQQRQNAQSGFMLTPAAGSLTF